MMPRIRQKCNVSHWRCIVSAVARHGDWARDWRDERKRGGRKQGSSGREREKIADHVEKRIRRKPRRRQSVRINGEESSRDNRRRRDRDNRGRARENRRGMVEKTSDAWRETT